MDCKTHTAVFSLRLLASVAMLAGCGGDTTADDSSHAAAEGAAHDNESTACPAGFKSKGSHCEPTSADVIDDDLPGGVDDSDDDARGGDGDDDIAADDDAADDTPPTGTTYDVSDLLESARAKWGLPALAAMVQQGDMVRAQGIAGVRKLDDNTPARIADKFHLGSCTKAMTATLAAMLIDRGLLDWDTTLSELFPDLAADMRPEYLDVTLDLLLAHHSGIDGDLLAQMEIWDYLWTSTDDIATTRHEFTRQMLALPPAAVVGQEYLYSNANFMIVGAALESLTGKTWEDLITTELFEPLGMNSCGFGAPGTPGRIDQPWGHRVKDGALDPVEPGPYADNPPALGPAGRVHCALADWLKFGALHLAGELGDESLLPAAQWHHMHRSPFTDQAYSAGWIIVDDSEENTRLTHSGSNTYWFATIWIFPARGGVIVAATNAAADSAFNALDETIYQLLTAYLAP